MVSCSTPEKHTSGLYDESPAPSTTDGDSASSPEAAGSSADNSPVKHKSEQSFFDSADGAHKPPLASATAITLNLITAGLGTGILTLPWGTAGASLLTSVFLLIPVLLVNAWTMMIMVRVSEIWQEFDIGGLLTHLPGKMGPLFQIMANATIWVAQLLCLVGYVIVVVDALEGLLPHGSIPRPLIAACMGVVVIPLCFLDQKHLAFTSTFSIFANVYVVALLIFYAVVGIEGDAITKQPLCLLGFAPGAATQYSLLQFTVLMQTMVLPMYKELDGRNPEKFRTCLSVAFVFLFLLLAGVMVCGYVIFGPAVQSNVLSALPFDGWSSAARLLMAMCCIGVFPIQFKPMISPFVRYQEVLRYGAPLSRRLQFDTPKSILMPSPRTPPHAPLSTPMESPLLGYSSSAPMTPPTVAFKALQANPFWRKAAMSGSLGDFQRQQPPNFMLPSQLDPHRFATLFTVPVLTVGIVVAIVVASLWLRDLGALNVIVGGVQVFSYLGAVPGIMGLYLLGDKGRYWTVLMYLLIIFSVASSIVGFVSTDNDVALLEENCMWTL